MTSILVKFGIGALIAWWISSAFSWNFWVVAIGIGVLVGVYSLAQHLGWFGMTPHTTAHGGGVSAGMTKLVVGFSTLTFVMMVGTSIIGVSNNYAFSYFLGLGPRPWLYPSGVTTDLLIWVSLFFISVVIAVLATRERMKPALVIFGITLVFLFIVREMPRTATAVAPKPIANMPAGSTPWQKTDQAVAESGAIPTAAKTGWKFLFGTTVERAAKGVGDWISSNRPRTAPTAVPTAAPAPAAPVVHVPTRTLYKFAESPNGCAEVELRSDASFYPKGGMVTIHPPSGNPWDDAPGIVNSQEGTTKPDGIYRICPQAPGNGATGVEIWN